MRLGALHQIGISFEDGGIGHLTIDGREVYTQGGFSLEWGGRGTLPVLTARIVGERVSGEAPSVLVAPPRSVMRRFADWILSRSVVPWGYFP